jgi:hypothetical protein
MIVQPSSFKPTKTKQASIKKVQASTQIITCHSFPSTHLSPSRLQRQSSGHGPERAIALTVGPVFRLPSSIKHGTQPVKIVEVSIKVSFLVFVVFCDCGVVMIGATRHSRIGYLRGDERARSVESASKLEMQEDVFAGFSFVGVGKHVQA